MDIANSILLLITILLAGYLIKELNEKHLLAFFQFYLMTFIFASVASSPIHPAITGFVLFMKVAATSEAFAILFRRMRPQKLLALLVVSSGAAIAAGIMSLAAPRQTNLAHPEIVLVKHFVQVVLATYMAIAVGYSWRCYVKRGSFTCYHAYLMLFLWLDYAFCGLMPAMPRYQWLNIQSLWYIIAMGILFVWIVAVRKLRRPIPRGASKSVPSDRIFTI